MGMNPLYNEFSNVPTDNQKQIDIEKIYNKLITVDKDLDLITDIADAYSMASMEGIANYLKVKYKQDAKLIAIVNTPITFFAKKYKSLNPATSGKRASEILSSLSRLMEYAKNRTMTERLTNEQSNTNQK